MALIEKCTVPSPSFLAECISSGMYVDSYKTEIKGHIPFSAFIFAFYTSPLFKIEQFILTYAARRPSNDLQARELAEGARNSFAIWDVEKRSKDELLMRDMYNTTRSWFKVKHLGAEKDAYTRLYFGSAATPRKDSKTGKASFGFIFQALLKFHLFYSVSLLYFTRRKISQG